MAHHGKDWEGTSFMQDDQVEHFKKALQDEQRKVEGLYTDGMINKHDEGTLACAIGTENGAVCLRFPKPVTWIGFTPDQAMDIAQQLIKHARKAGLTRIVTFEL